MKIIAEPCLCKDLQPGDLFSTLGQEYWDCAGGGVGEKVYIRTLVECPEDQADDPIYRITILLEKQ
jgi:hypothetical protein